MRIALLEDDPDQAALTRLWLEQAEHRVTCIETGDGFLRALRRDSFDLYIIDWLLPDINGIEVVKRLRREMRDYTPVIVATVKSDEQHIVKALEAGADDYLVKPMRQGELVARVLAARRRADGGRIEAVKLASKPYEFDIDNNSVRLFGEPLSLTEREFELTLFFFRHVNQALSRSHILASIWGIENERVTTRTVDTHVSRLRKKLRFGEETGWQLSSIYQHGYRLESPVEQSTASEGAS
ncbi:MAG: response regulator transcription factor [Woeseiaceae bacterium]